MVVFLPFSQTPTNYYFVVIFMLSLKLAIKKNIKAVSQLQNSNQINWVYVQLP